MDVFFVVVFGGLYMAWERLNAGEIAEMLFILCAVIALVCAFVYRLLE